MKLDRSLLCRLENIPGGLIKVGVWALPNFLDVQLCLTRLQSSRHVPLRSDEFKLDSEGGLTLCDSASQTTSYC